jgi:CDP-diacylglycerol--serine O-phosphatidyltransferase
MDMNQLARLPNLITFLNVVFGFAAVASLIRWSQGLGGGPAQAAWFILIAAMLDAMDGKLARAIGHQSQFGKELDSLSDAVSFGLAPSVLLYTLHFSAWGERGPLFALAGFLISAMPLTFGCYRLARFNVETSVEEKKSALFAGLPIPAAAGLIASYVLFCLDLFDEVWSQGLLPLTLLASFLMVSRVRFEGMPYFSLRQGSRNLTRLLLLVAILGSVMFLQAKALFPAAAIYLAYSIIRHLRQDPAPALDEDEADEEEWTDKTRF